MRLASFSCLLLFFFISTTAGIFEKELLPHECGIAVVRLRKPLSYYQDKYQDVAWGLRKVCLLLEKQRNRGQDGAGIAAVKLAMPGGTAYLKRLRSAATNALEELFNRINHELNQLPRDIQQYDDLTLKERVPMLAECYIGHIRYGTYGSAGITYTQPLLHKHTNAAHSFALCGNFNMTNMDELFDTSAERSITPSTLCDTHIIMDLLAQEFESNSALTLLQKSQALGSLAHTLDGGYVFALLFGTGQLAVIRDPAGIRPGFIYCDDEVIALASERAALTSAFKCEADMVKPLPAGCVVSIDLDGTINTHPFAADCPQRQCVFERIYFSRGNDPAIYNERKALGAQLATRIVHELNDTLDNTLFTFIPNTSETAFLGMLSSVRTLMVDRQIDTLCTKLANQELTDSDLRTLAVHARMEKITHKDQLLRTFIAQDENRLNLVANIYDVTRGITTPQTRLVVMDDSIVRGTTLRESIVRQLASLNPAQLIIVSGAPPVLYPDCYGIDMSQIGRLIGFQATIALLQERDQQHLIDECARLCEQSLEQHIYTNHVKLLYASVSQQDIERKIAQLIRPSDCTWLGPIRVIYQTIGGLQRAMPEHTGDWYFTGKYPTPGGYRVLCISFLQWYNGVTTQRAY